MSGVVPVNAREVLRNERRERLVESWQKRLVTEERQSQPVIFSRCDLNRYRPRPFTETDQSESVGP